MSVEAAFLVAALPWAFEKVLEHTVGGLGKDACTAIAGKVWHEVTTAPGPPENHDIARAVRSAQLGALEDVVAGYHKANIARWEHDQATAPQVFTTAAIKFCREQRRRVRDDEASLEFTPSETLTAAIEGLLADSPRFSEAGERAAALGFFAEQTVLDELAAVVRPASMPDGFAAYLRASDGQTTLRFLDLFSDRIAELVKDQKDTRFRDILTTRWLADLKAQGFDHAELLARIDARFGGLTADLSELRLKLDRYLGLIERRGNLGDRRVSAPLLGGKFPDVGTTCVGRSKETEWLDAAWADPTVGVAAVIAFGGVGKTTLVWNWWLHHHHRTPCTVLRQWSFYRQGTSEHQEASNAFVEHALRTWYGIEPPVSTWEQGERLANCIREEHALLLLDGLEPLQFQNPLDPLFGGFKDNSMIALLQSLATSGDGGLCVCTSRVHLRDLRNYEGHGFQSRNLSNLTPASGSKYLYQLGVRGLPEEREQASAAFGNHALSLKLLGNYLTVFRERDPLRVDTLPPLFADPNTGGHARRMMKEYETILSGRPYGSVLRLLGLFDRPACPSAIAALRRPPAINGLTDALPPLGSDAWIAVLGVLQQLGLIEYDEQSQSVDCHPLVREYFGELLKGAGDVAEGADNTDSSSAWKEANRRLLEYYASVPTEEHPTTSDDMGPLYIAVQHACEAHEYAAAWDIYWRRIQRGHPEYFNTNALGAFQAGLAHSQDFTHRLGIQLRWASLGHSAAQIIVNY